MTAIERVTEQHDQRIAWLISDSKRNGDLRVAISMSEGGC